MSVLFILALAFTVSAADVVSFTSDDISPVNHGETLSFTLTMTSAGPAQQVGKLKLEAVSNGFDVNLPAEAGEFDWDTENPKEFTIEVPVERLTAAGNYDITFSLFDDINGDDVVEELVDDGVITFEVLAQSALTASLSDNDVIVPNGDDPVDERQVVIELTNTGNVDLTGANEVTVRFVHGDDPVHTIEDGNDRVNFRYSRLQDLGINAIGTITITIDADRNMDPGEYNGKFEVLIGGVVQEALSTDFQVLVSENMCDEGIRGNNLQVTIEDPDSGDDYQPGDEINLEVNVENDDNSDMRVIVEATLINMDDGRRLDSRKTDDQKIDENDNKDFDLKLTIDEDKVDDGDTLMIFVKAYEEGDEDTECVEEFTDIEIEKEDDDVRITELNLLPKALMCGQTGEVVLDIKNFGADDQVVRAKIFNSELGIEKESDRFDLEEDEDDNEAVVRFRIQVPENAKDGEYSLEARVLYSGSDESVFETLTVTCNPSAEEVLRAANQDSVQEVGVTNQGSSTQSAQDTVSAGTATVTGKTIFDQFNTQRTTPVALWVLADLILVLIIVFIIYLAFRRR